MSRKKTFKEIVIFAIPLLLFAILLVPYSWFNQQFVIDWFGCGCPMVDADGNEVASYFNANDFTLLFWSIISICAVTLSVFVSKRIPKDKIWVRIIYIAGTVILSVLISCELYQTMMWC